MFEVLETEVIRDLASLAPAERDRLVRFCARLSGDAHAAEDLAQETLIEAWRHLHALKNPDVFQSWLFGIARNVCLRARRRAGREAVRLAQCLDQEGAVRDEPAGDFDVEIELERNELAELLDRALGLLPAVTRSVLIARYIDELPQSEIASRLGISEGAVEGKLHRGRLALRRVLSTDLKEEARVYGLGAGEETEWQETRIWCPFCGKRRLVGRVDRVKGEAIFRCRQCEAMRERQITHTFTPQVLGGVTSYKAVLSRQIAWLHQHYAFALEHLHVSCPFCGRETHVQFGLPAHEPPWFTGSAGMHIICPTCGITDANPLHYLVLDLPSTQRFWRRHPRMRVQPDKPVAFEGRDAILTAFQSVDGSARLDVISDAQTLAMLAAHASDGDA